jgi:hypothetical protein
VSEFQNLLFRTRYTGNPYQVKHKIKKLIFFEGLQLINKCRIHVVPSLPAAAIDRFGSVHQAGSRKFP